VGAWLAQSVKHKTLDLGIVEFKPHVGCGAHLKKKNTHTHTNTPKQKIKCRGEQRFYIYAN